MVLCCVLLIFDSALSAQTNLKFARFVITLNFLYPLSLLALLITVFIG